MGKRHDFDELDKAQKSVSSVRNGLVLPLDEVEGSISALTDTTQSNEAEIAELLNSRRADEFWADIGGLGPIPS